jgi:SAM-dependent methyltransferase
MSDTLTRFRADYADHRAAEGRAVHGEALLSLPYLRTGPFAGQWAVRARSFDAFIRHVLKPMEHGDTLKVLDLGAGNGWLAHRVARRGHQAVALDIRDDEVDGLGVAAEFLRHAPDLFKCVIAPFEDLPFAAGRFDITLFNASLHYAQNLTRVLAEAVRVTRPNGILVIMDSPFYDRERDGAAMVAEKLAQGSEQFGARAERLLSHDFIEYLTLDRLAVASPGLQWRRRRVLYPLWYELRPLRAKLQGTRPPSRFDLWTAIK